VCNHAVTPVLVTVCALTLHLAIPEALFQYILSTKDRRLVSALFDWLICLFPYTQIYKRTGVGRVLRSLGSDVHYQKCAPRAQKSAHCVHVKSAQRAQRIRTDTCV